MIKSIFFRISNMNFTDTNNSNLKEDIIDALILFGLTFFTNLGSQLILGQTQIFQAFIQGGIIFFFFLALKRGLIHNNSRYVKKK